jgi:hypothetical protein
MTPHQILIVAIRLFAVFLTVSVLGQIGGIVATAEEFKAQLVTVWISIAIQLSVCLVLWFFPATLAGKLLHSGGARVSSEPVPISEWRDLCFIAIGLFVLVRAVPNAVYWLVMAVASEPYSHEFDFEQKINAIATVLECVIGVSLIIGSKALGDLIQRLRRGT